MNEEKPSVAETVAGVLFALVLLILALPALTMMFLGFVAWFKFITGV